MKRPRYAPVPGYESRSFPARVLALARFGIRAIFELARARRAFAKHSPAALLRNNQRVEAVARPAAAALPDDHLLVEQVSFVIPRIAHRVPWRSDCLVQALAAQKWLETAGVATRLAIGAEQSAAKGFNAHAWLKHGETVVTGGEIEHYETLLD